MFHVLTAAVLIGNVAASRVMVETHDDGHLKSRFGASCEHLQSVFHNRIVAIQAALDSHPENDFSSATTAGLMMRSYAVVRTLRRARECSWVIDGDSEEIEVTRVIVRRVLAEHPCAEAARVELAAGQNAESAEIELQSVVRAMSVLTGENCEVVIAEGDAPDVAEVEDAVQDGIDELAEESESELSALIETNSGTIRQVLKTIALVFLVLLLTLVCASALAIITFFVVAVLIFLAENIGLMRPPSSRNMFPPGLVFGVLGGMVAGVTGLGVCSYQLYNQLLVPRTTTLSPFLPGCPNGSLDACNDACPAHILAACMESCQHQCIASAM